MFVKVKQDSEIIYPYTLEQFRAEHRNISMPAALSNAFLANWGVFPVVDAVKPEYDPIYQTALRVDMPHLDGEQWKIGWVIIDKSAEQVQAEFELRKDEFRKEVNEARDTAIYTDLNVNVNETTVVPVNLRRGGADIQNISGLTMSATLKLISGDPSPFVFRGADDVNYELTPQETILLGKAVGEHYSSKYAKAWALKDMLINLTKTEEINSIVIDF